MIKKFFPVSDPGGLRKMLEKDIISNAGFIWRVFQDEEPYSIFATEDLGSALAIQWNSKRVMFVGDWSDTDVPLHLLPKDSVSVASSPLSPIEQLKNYYTLEGEWPCWCFLAPRNFGHGAWDELGPLAPSESSFVASFWELGGEEHITQCLKQFDSVCLRVGGKPVSWCGLHFEIEGVGNLGFAHTLEAHRKKGYAQAVTKALVNRMAARGARATSHVIKDNAASIATCKSMGFELTGEVGWADFKARD